MKYVFGRQINLLRGAKGMKRGYEIFRDEGIVKQFYSDNGHGRNLNCWEFPDGARTMEFVELGSNGEGIVGPPMYRDSRGKVIKIGNR